MSDLVIKNGKVVLPERTYTGDILIDGGKIEKIGKNLSAGEVIDARGKYVLPGLIDAHVHFREPGGSNKEDWLTGSSAAAAGGVTCVLEMPNTQPPTVTKELLYQKRKFARRSLVDYGFHFGASTGNIDELRKIDRIASVKFYMGSTTGSLLVESDAILFEQLSVLAERDIPATVHAESENMISYLTKKLRAQSRDDAEAYSEARPNMSAADAVNRILSLTKLAKNRVHLCHISTKEELGVIGIYRKNMPLTSEASPHHLFLTREDYKTLGTLAKTNPPMRSKEDRAALWKAIREGAIDIIATDHAPHSLESKSQGIWDAPSGVPGLETMLPLLLNEVNKGGLNMRQLVHLTAENPARIFSIKNKGCIKAGYDADLVIADMSLAKKVDDGKLFTKCGWSPFAGRELKGWPVTTIVRGNIVYDEGIIHKNRGAEVLYDRFS
ncbi:MAG: dihydroorotase [Candidatus Altiarchaeia archaeon]